MTTSYKYNEPSPAPTFGPLPEGEYAFTVLQCGELYTSSAGNTVLPVKLAVGKENAHVFDRPWSGPNGDRIAGFLKSCNCAPAAGQEPDWRKIEGANGRVRLKIEVATAGSMAGKQVNRVNYYIYADSVTQPQTFTTAQVKQREMQSRKAVHDPDLDVEPDDIPF